MALTRLNPPNAVSLVICSIEHKLCGQPYSLLLSVYSLTFPSPSHALLHKAEVFPEQMEAVERELKGAEGKWKELGRTLEIPEKTLDEIERTTDSEDRLHQVLEEWVKRNGEEGTRATWKSLKDSLKVVGNDSIVQDLELQNLGKDCLGRVIVDIVV